jgi:hypothetical protein
MKSSPGARELGRAPGAAARPDPPRPRELPAWRRRSGEAESFRSDPSASTRAPIASATGEGRSIPVARSFSSSASSARSSSAARRGTTDRRPDAAQLGRVEHPPRAARSAAARAPDPVQRLRQPSRARSPGGQRRRRSTSAGSGDGRGRASPLGFRRVASKAAGDGGELERGEGSRIHGPECRAAALENRYADPGGAVEPGQATAALKSFFGLSSTTNASSALPRKAERKRESKTTDAPPRVEERRPGQRPTRHVAARSVLCIARRLTSPHEVGNIAAERRGRRTATHGQGAGGKRGPLGSVLLTHPKPKGAT